MMAYIKNNILIQFAQAMLTQASQVPQGVLQFMSKPLLSICMIFKNEIRCLERCLKSLQPLRDAIPCELVMADTGPSDGSKEIAERYVDEVFDFPWIDDFSAARDAVMGRCTGEWYLNIDCDEWFDGDYDQVLS